MRTETRRNDAPGRDVLQTSHATPLYTPDYTISSRPGQRPETVNCPAFPPPEFYVLTSGKMRRIRICQHHPPIKRQSPNRCVARHALHIAIAFETLRNIFQQLTNRQFGHIMIVIEPTTLKALPADQGGTFFGGFSMGETILKPALTLDAQVERLENAHSLAIDNREEAREILSRVNYYRLSAYGIGLKRPDDPEKYRDRVKNTICIPLFIGI